MENKEILGIQQLLFEEKINGLKNFGIRKEILMLAHPHVLKDSFRGIHNLGEGIPRGMWKYLNPDEGLALYVATPDVKRYHFSEAPKDFKKLISYLNRKAWESKYFASLSNKFEHPFHRTPGSQGPRLEMIAQKDADDFMDNFFGKKFVSSLSENSFEGEYYDPNGDAWGMINKELYVTPVYNHVKSIYKSNK